jgi:hypothetical protein
MNKLYLIQYTLKNDPILVPRIKTLGTWMNYFPQSWIVKTHLNAQEIYEKISVDLEKDRILIMELDKINYWGIMPKEAWNFLKNG